MVVFEAINSPLCTFENVDTFSCFGLNYDIFLSSLLLLPEFCVLPSVVVINLHTMFTFVCMCVLSYILYTHSQNRVLQIIFGHRKMYFMSWKLKDISY